MIYAWISGLKRAPLKKGERTLCGDCGGLLTSVVPAENMAHWRHKAGDCDSWAEPEGLWHLGWKELFDPPCREVSLVDAATGERHRADILCSSGPTTATILELQHSSISDDERASREAFYRQKHRMFWLVHIHNDHSFLETNFALSMDFSSRHVNIASNTFSVMRWRGRGQFIERWKRASAHVFFDWRGCILYLARESVAARYGVSFGRGEFALCLLTREKFIRAVQGAD